MSHEIPLSLGAEAFLCCRTQHGQYRYARACSPCRGRRAHHAWKDRVGNWDIPRLADGKMPPRSASGRRRAVADDVRAREVGRGHSSWEIGEQGGAIRRGAGGAKGRGQGECWPATHALDPEPGCACHWRWPHTHHRIRDEASGPEVGAVCGKAARTDLCGGRGAILVPTATASLEIGCCRFRHRFRLIFECRSRASPTSACHAACAASMRLCPRGPTSPFDRVCKVARGQCIPHQTPRATLPTLRWA